MLLRLIRGAVSGLVATVPMSTTMLMARRLGLVGQLPPKLITEAATDAVEAPVGPNGKKALSVASHFGFGAMAGALFALWPRGRASRVRQGVAYGTLVWLVSYAGWVPALGIMPPPERDRRYRPASMLVSHWVYGATLGLLA